MANRKSWDELSPAYQRRLARGGLTPANYDTPEGERLRVAARGHSKTPEHPERARKNPERYRDYLGKREDYTRAVMARKERLFGTRVKFRPRNAEKNVLRNPRTNDKPNQEYMRRFLTMTGDEVLAIDWSDDEWGFLFYH